MSKSLTFTELEERVKEALSKDPSQVIELRDLPETSYYPLKSRLENSGYLLNTMMSLATTNTIPVATYTIHIRRKQNA